MNPCYIPGGGKTQRGKFNEGNLLNKILQGVFISVTIIAGPSRIGMHSKYDS